MIHIPSSSFAHELRFVWLYCASKKGWPCCGMKQYWCQTQILMHVIASVLLASIKDQYLRQKCAWIGTPCPNRLAQNETSFRKGAEIISIREITLFKLGKKDSYRRKSAWARGAVIKMMNQLDIALLVFSARLGLDQSICHTASISPPSIALVSRKH